MLNRILASIALAALGVGCSADEPKAPSPAITSTTLRPGHVERTVHARVDMTITGERPLTLKAEPTKLRLVTIEGPANPSITHFFSISTAEPVKLDEDSFLQFDADLAPSLYKGPGRYTLDSRPPKIQGQQTPLASASYVQFLDLQPQPVGPKFDIISKPCTLVVGEDALTGSVDCPELSSVDNKTVALRWSWELI